MSSDLDRYQIWGCDRGIPETQRLERDSLWDGIDKWFKSVTLRFFFVCGQPANKILSLSVLIFHRGWCFRILLDHDDVTVDFPAHLLLLWLSFDHRNLSVSLPDNSILFTSVICLTQSFWTQESYLTCINFAKQVSKPILFPFWSVLNFDSCDCIFEYSLATWVL